MEVACHGDTSVIVTGIDPDMPSHVAVTKPFPVTTEEKVTVAYPFASVIADVSERFPKVASNVTCALATGFPLSRTSAVIGEVEFAGIMSGSGESVTVP